MTDIKTALDSRRQQDELRTLVIDVVERYGMGGKSYEITRHTSGLQTTAYFWQASAVYRHRRKKLGIKGEVCKLLIQRDESFWRRVHYHSCDLFMGKHVSDIERDIINNKAWVYFECGGKPIRWRCKIYDLLRGERNKRGDLFVLSMTVPLHCRLQDWKKWKPKPTPQSLPAIWNEAFEMFEASA